VLPEKLKPIQVSQCLHRRLHVLEGNVRLAAHFGSSTGVDVEHGTVGREENVEFAAEIFLIQIGQVGDEETRAG
jgi:hypothetical protein